MQDNINAQMLGLSALLLCLLTLPCCSEPPGEMIVTPVGRRQATAVTKQPNLSWVPLYFQAIDERARLAGLPDLRGAAQVEGDVEVRLWVGFGLVPLEGVVIRRQGGTWSATHLESINPELKSQSYEQALPEPKAGWDNFWKHIRELGVLTLPDDSQLPEKVRVTDGKSYVVELKVNNSYRTYRYSNPHRQSWPEAKRMLELASFIFDQFEIER